MKPVIYAMCGIFGGDRNAAIKKISETLASSNTKHIIISADAIRNELYKDEKDFSTLYSLIEQRVNLALDSGHNVILDSDNSGFKKTIWLRVKFGLSAKIKKVQVLQTQDSVFSWVNYLTLEEARIQLPYYFQHSKSDKYAYYNPKIRAGYREGPERGVAVAKDEIARHLQDYKAGLDGNLVYKNWF